MIEKLKDIAKSEFSDVVVDTSEEKGKLRIFIKDGSFVDVWFSRNIPGRYAYHWNRGKEIYRHDNIPHKKWKNIKTFPKHFHNGSEDCVCESTISDVPEEAIREFLEFIRKKLKTSP